MGTSEFNAVGNPVMDEHLIQERVEILLVASCNRNWDKLWPYGPPGSCADFTFAYHVNTADNKICVNNKDDLPSKSCRLYCFINFVILLVQNV